MSITERPMKITDLKLKNRVTVIEDNADLLQLVTLILKNAGYNVVAKSNGSGLLTSGEGMTDLYLIDSDLGSVSGLDLCRAIKEATREVAPKIIMVSANPDLRALAMEACADDTLSKPFNTKELLRKVSEYLPIEK
jgi:DNA-binding response OmpR family regulator